MRSRHACYVHVPPLNCTLCGLIPKRVSALKPTPSLAAERLFVHAALRRQGFLRSATGARRCVADHSPSSASARSVESSFSRRMIAHRTMARTIERARSLGACGQTAGGVNEVGQAGGGAAGAAPSCEFISVVSCGPLCSASVAGVKSIADQRVSAGEVRWQAHITSGCSGP